MKRRFLMITMCLFVTGALLVGCGNKKDEKPSDTNVDVNTQQESTEKVETEKDWKKAYNGYFTENDFTDDVKIITKISGSPAKYEAEVSGKMELITISFDGNSTIMYCDDEYITMAVKTNELSESGKMIVPSGEEGMLSTSNFTSYQTGIIKAIKDMVSVKYVDEFNANGVIYDIIEIETPWGKDGIRYVVNDNGAAVGIYEGVSTQDAQGNKVSYEDLPEYATVKFYINRETQEIESFSGIIEGFKQTGQIKKIDAIMVPEVIASAKELSEEEFSVLFMKGIALLLGETFDGSAGDDIMSEPEVQKVEISELNGKTLEELIAMGYSYSGYSRTGSSAELYLNGTGSEQWAIDLFKTIEGKTVAEVRNMYDISIGYLSFNDVYTFTFDIGSVSFSCDLANGKAAREAHKDESFFDLETAEEIQNDKLENLQITNVQITGELDDASSATFCEIEDVEEEVVLPIASQLVFKNVYGTLN